jgi:hypothetical protein
MGFKEWMLSIIILYCAYHTYQKQEYWLDRKVARFIRYLKSLFR